MVVAPSLTLMVGVLDALDTKMPNKPPVPVKTVVVAVIFFAFCAAVTEILIFVPFVTVVNELPTYR